jgi:hypothetical protein
MSLQLWRRKPGSECMRVGRWDEGTAPHLIIVGYFLAPGPGGPDAVLNARLLRALADHWPSGVSVISGGGPPIPEGDGGCLSTKPGWVFHIGSGSIRGLRNRQSFLYRCVNRAVYELTGEGLKGQFWVRFAARALDTELDAHPNAIVYSRSLPHMSLEAVSRVRRKRSFRWLVNINDPLPPDIWPGQYPFDAKSCKAIRRSLHSVMPLVDAFTFPCSQLRTLEIKAFDQMGRSPTAILPHLPGRSIPSPSATPGAARLHIAYAGDLSRRRCRTELVPSLREFARQEPKLAGQLYFSFYLSKRHAAAIEFIQSLPFSTSVSVDLPPTQCDEALSYADVLLDIASDVDSPLLMTKMATYLGLNRPVWAICNPDGTSWNLVRRGWGYASDVHSGESVCATLRQILADWSAGVLADRRPPAPMWERFTPARLVADLLALSEYISSPRLGDSVQPDCLKTDWP